MAQTSVEAEITTLYTSELSVAALAVLVKEGITIKRITAKTTATTVWKMIALAGTRFLFSRAMPTGRRWSMPDTRRRRA